MSSDDSFEQSIKAELEQFLNEKKPQARKEAAAGGTQEKLAIRSQKEGINRVSPSSQKRGDKALFLRRHPGKPEKNKDMKAKLDLIQVVMMVSRRLFSFASLRKPGKQQTPKLPVFLLKKKS